MFDLIIKYMSGYYGTYQWFPTSRWEVYWRAYDCWACVRFPQRPSRLAWHWWTASWGTRPLFPLGTHPALRQTRCLGPEIGPRPVVYHCRCSDYDDDSGDRWSSFGCYRPLLVLRIYLVPVGRSSTSPADRPTRLCPVLGRSSCTDADISSPTPVAYHIHMHAHTNDGINSRVNNDHRMHS